MKKAGFGMGTSRFAIRAAGSRMAVAAAVFAVAIPLALAAVQDDDDAPKKAQAAPPPSSASVAKQDADDAPAKPATTAASATQPAAQDDDDDAPKNAEGTTPTLNREQREAVGIVVAHVVKAKPAERIAAFGQVLDPSALIGDVGDLDANRAAERAASAEVARLQGLYKAGASASLKNLESAEAEQAHARAQAQAASARVALRWAPVASMAAADRQKLIESASSGRSALVRVDLPGRHSIGRMPEAATLDVDGIAVGARVLGALAEASGAQSASLLVSVDRPPLGLAAGARVAVSLAGIARDGYLVPRGALIYEEGGAFVYHALDAKPGDDKTQYARKKVTLLMPSGDGWLVDGLDDDDRIVVHGSGVLWSLEGIGTMPEDDDD
jgi:predicted pyridoxine 5'-phosphate oxidase superfamily flavin-nucleotide-binding protein